MKKRVVAIAAAALMSATAVGALAGCGGNEKTITVFLLANAHEVEFYQKYFEEMEQTLKEEGLDYEIDFNGEQEGNYYDSLGGDIQGGETPDIFYLRPNELMQYKTEIVSLQDYAEEHGFTDDASKRIADLTDIYEEALNMYRFNPTTGELGNPNDDLYAFPKDLSTQQLGYNRTLLEKYERAIKDAGYKKMPWEMDFDTENYSWEQFKGMCKAIADAIEAAKVADPNLKNYPCDVPPIEVLAKSFGADLIDMSGGRANATVTSPASGALNEAIRFQSEFIDCGAGDYENATYANFGAGRVCFYGAVGSWEIADYNTLLNVDEAGNPVDKECWGVMPWPTKDGSTNWQGLITSAGYVISKDCADSPKGEVAMRIALSFLSNRTQDRLVKEEKISLPLRKSVKEDYLDPENNDKYTPSTRRFFLDVVSGDHGFVPAKYKTYDSVWLKELDDALTLIWGGETGGKDKALTQFNNTNWTNVANRMQLQYNETKNS